MKIDINGLVLNKINNDYSCSRGCLQCSSTSNIKYKDSINLQFLKTFLKRLFKNNMYFTTLSLNNCWDFTENHLFIIKYIFVLLKIKLIKKWYELLLYSNINRFIKNDMQNYLKYYNKIHKIIKFNIWIWYWPNDLNINISKLLENIFLLLDSYYKIKIILHRDINGKYSKKC